MKKEQEHLYLSVLLEEYKCIRETMTAVHARLDTAVTIILTVLSALIGFLSVYPASINYHFYLASAIIYSLLGLYISFAQTQLNLLAAYEHHVLRKKIELCLQSVSQGESIYTLEWLAFQRKALTGGKLNTIISVFQAASIFLIPVGASLGFIAFYLVLKMESKTSWSIGEISIFIACMSLFIVMLLSFISSLRAYSYTPEKSLNSVSKK